MKLAEFMDVEGLTDAAVGARVKKSRVTISRYRRQLEPIPGDVVKELVEFSKGKMTANELLGIEPSHVTSQETSPQAAE